MCHPPYGLLSKCQNHKEDGEKICGLLRKAELYEVQNLRGFNDREELRVAEKVSIQHKVRHKVDIKEGASDQFPKYVFNFWSYGQLRSIRGKHSIMSTF